MGRIYSDVEVYNREIILDFYDKAIVNWDFEAAKIHLGDHYIQHTPDIADGVEGLKAFIDGIPPAIKAVLKSEVRRVLVDGDMVAIHSFHSMPDWNGRAIVDIFRVEDGKVVEHWDVVQDVPGEAKHSNGMV